MVIMMNDMYWGKMMYANNKMKKNSEVETLTEEQHEVLAELCAIWSGNLTRKSQQTGPQSYNWPGWSRYGGWTEMV